MLGNLLRSTRYGAISSRIGKVKNVLAGVVFSDCELFSNSKLTQAVYDLLSNGESEPDFPLAIGGITAAVRSATATLVKGVIGRLTILPAEDVAELVPEMANLYGNEEAVKKMLERTSKMYGPQG